MEVSCGTSGSLQGVLVGSHYNHAWTVHNVFSEALERLLLLRFIYEINHTVPQILLELIDISIGELSNFTQQYENYRSSVRNGDDGKTPQFWMLYLDLTQKQTMAHAAIQENDIDMLISAWQTFIPLYFSMNKVNYARYGSYYIHTLINMEHIYPDLRELLSRNGMSVQAQDRYPHRTSIDQRGEQTEMLKHQV